MATRTPVTPFYAIAGAGDLAVEKFRAISEDVTARFAKLDQKTLQTELTKRQTELAKLVEKRFETLIADARTAPAKLRELPAVAQAGFTTVLGQAEETYEDLAGRGKDLVERIRHQQATADLETQVKSTVSKAKATRTTVKKTAQTATRTVKATATSARKTAKAAGKAAGSAADKIGD
jgi:heparin binding hemagglutinin HbhA